VVVTLPDSKKWAGVNYPQPFPEDSVEFSVAEAFARLPQYNNTLGNIVSGSFFKRTKKRKGAGHDRAYRLEPYIQEGGGVYGKLNANTMVVYLPASHMPVLETPPSQVPSSHTPFQHPPCETPPIDMTPLERHPIHMLSEAQQGLPILQVEEVQVSSEGGHIGSITASSSSPVIDLTTPTFQNHDPSDENYLDFLSDEWVRLQEAYFATLERKNKKMSASTNHDFEDLQRSKSFWKSFSELETEVLQDATSTIKNITLGLVHRRNLKRGINCTDSDINKITSHLTMQMFTPADLKMEFEKNARLFWREWDYFDYLIKKAPKDAKYLDAAHVLIRSHGKEGAERINELEELLELDTNKKISLKLLDLMCKSNIAPKDVEEEESLQEYICPN